MIKPTAGELDVVRSGTEAAATLGRLPLLAWNVKGRRDLGGGAYAEVTACSFGRTAEQAREFFHRHFNKGTGENTIGRGFIWRDNELALEPINGPINEHQRGGAK